METTERRTTDGLGTGLAARCDVRLQATLWVDDVARFTWEPASDGWCWSTGMYALHGYTPRAVEPGLDVLLQHQHPQHRARTRDA